MFSTRKRTSSKINFIILPILMISSELYDTPVCTKNKFPRVKLIIANRNAENCWPHSNTLFSFYHVCRSAWVLDHVIDKIFCCNGIFHFRMCLRSTFKGDGRRLCKYVVYTRFSLDSKHPV